MTNNLLKNCPNHLNKQKLRDALGMIIPPGNIQILHDLHSLWQRFNGIRP